MLGNIATIMLWHLNYKRMTSKDNKWVEEDKYD